MAEPWLQHGYNALLIDPKHGKIFSQEIRPEGGKVWRVGAVLASREAAYYLRIAISYGVQLVAGFPPCTDVAISGARWFEEKRAKDPHFQAKAALVAEQCRMIGMLSGAPWFFENPGSVFSSIFGPASYIFNPCDFGGYLPEDDVHPLYPDIFPARDGYTKKTFLWTGGGFCLPERRPVPGAPFQTAIRLGGKSERTKQIRSTTPRGFARAVFEHYNEASNDEQYGNGEFTRALQCG
ncbi:dcm methylase [Leclercia sp. Marseille-Q4284]|uniref:dcm methylase n=1 Tax=Leclercia sp. Marseille-Q4284 TaxID=2866582 RepID=UPI001CE4A825|nr:dcm methylase [Leclercia sp. Marseille-Q4284]